MRGQIFLYSSKSSIFGEITLHPEGVIAQLFQKVLTICYQKKSKILNDIMKEPLKSIIMPSYETEKYISSAIESVVRQTCSNWELIIIDDCSKDNTTSIISKK